MVKSFSLPKPVINFDVEFPEENLKTLSEIENQINNHITPGGILLHHKMKIIFVNSIKYYFILLSF